jgi:hypothetical protein
MFKKVLNLVLFLFLLAGIVYAQNAMEQGGKRIPPSRVPPQAAIDVCKDKAQGTACEVSTPDGNKPGICTDTPDKKYFVCMPKDMPPEDGGGPSKEGEAERPDNPPQRPSGR